MSAGDASEIKQPNIYESPWINNSTGKRKRFFINVLNLTFEEFIANEFNVKLSKIWNETNWLWKENDRKTEISSWKHLSSFIYDYDFGVTFSIYKKMASQCVTGNKRFLSG